MKVLEYNSDFTPGYSKCHHHVHHKKNYRSSQKQNFSEKRDFVIHFVNPQMIGYNCHSKKEKGQENKIDN